MTQDGADEAKRSKTLNLIIGVQVGAVLIGAVLLAWQKWGGGNPAEAGSPEPRSGVRADGPDEPAELKIPVRWTREPLGQLALPEIRVQKSAGVMTILDAGEPVKSYRVAVGPAPGPKRAEGDLRTPEGNYYVCLKQGRGQTRFVRALGLNYPNAADAAKALAEGRISKSQHDKIVYEVDRGRQPPWNTPLGGEILIHGKKDGRSETLGCIAVEDEEIVEIFPRIVEGTPVIILP